MEYWDTKEYELVWFMAWIGREALENSARSISFWKKEFIRNISCCFKRDDKTKQVFKEKCTLYVGAGYSSGPNHQSNK